MVVNYPSPRISLFLTWELVVGRVRWTRNGVMPDGTECWVKIASTYYRRINFSNESRSWEKICPLQQQHVCYVNIYWLEMDHPNIDKMLNWNEKSYQIYSKNHNQVKMMFSCLLFCYIPLHSVKKRKNIRLHPPLFPVVKDDVTTKTNRKNSKHYWGESWAERAGDFFTSKRN